MKLRLNLLNTILILTSIIIISSCGFYRLNGVSIPPDIKSYYVETIIVKPNNAPPDLNVVFREALRKKIREESRLTENENNPDAIFTGVVDGYRITPVAPKEGNTTSFSRLEIDLKFEYSNLKNEEDFSNKRYSSFIDFDRNADFSSIEDALIITIVDDIVTRAFNDAFTNW